MIATIIPLAINTSNYKRLNALFFGLTQDPVSTNFQRLGCLRQLGVNVQAHNTGVHSASRSLYHRVRRKLTRAWFSADEIRGYNKSVLKACVGAAPDFVWFEWPLQMERQTLLLIRERWPQALLVCFQDDNPFGGRKIDRHRWRSFIENISFYDVHFVKRPSDVVEFSKRGAKRVLSFQHGVYEPLFHPDNRPPNKRGPIIPVSFVGTALDHRVGYIAGLISRHKLPVRVYGAKWEQSWVGWRCRDLFWGVSIARIIPGSFGIVESLWPSFPPATGTNTMGGRLKFPVLVGFF